MIEYLRGLISGFYEYASVALMISVLCIKALSPSSQLSRERKASPINLPPSASSSPAAQVAKATLSTDGYGFRVEEHNLDRLRHVQMSRARQ